MTRPRSATTLRDIALLRLRNQRLVGHGFATAAEAVSWLGAVQAQDYAGATWALGQRVRAASAADIERAFAAGEIVRTHVLRPTWHFVAPEDIRWLLQLTAARVRAAVQYYDRQLGLDAAAVKRGQSALRGALTGGQQLTRNELAPVLEAEGQRLAHLLMHAELDAVICSGPRRGKQFTYMLLDERVPETASKTREQALSELSLRFFRSHGPALPQDFAWWSGLTITDAKAGLALIREHVSELVIDERRYFHAGDDKPPRLTKPVIHLLPNYDEQLIAYKERSAAFDRERVAKLGSREAVLSNHLITLDGRVIGGWRRAGTKPNAPLQLTLLTKLDARERAELDAARARFTQFWA